MAFLLLSLLLFDLKLGLVFVSLLGIVGLFVCLFLSVTSFFLFLDIVRLLIFRHCEFFGRYKFSCF